MKNLILTNKQEDILSNSYDWAVSVITRQKRILPLDTMWQAYPFKKDGLTKEGLTILLDKIKDQLFN